VNQSRDAAMNLKWLASLITIQSSGKALLGP
jgi:hypothetical protein